MTPRQCPICQVRAAQAHNGNFDYFKCEVCRGVHIDNRLVRAPTTLDNWPDLLAAASELREEFSFPPTIRFDGTVTCPDETAASTT